MLQDIKDEILSGEPRYTIQDNDGRVINDNVQITLKTTVTQDGTPINKVLFQNLQGDLYTEERYSFPSYSGTAMTLTLPLTSYETNKIVRIKAPANLTNPTLNINGLGAKTVSGTLKTGKYYTLVYSGSKWLVKRDMLGESKEPIIITESGTYSIDTDITYKVVAVGGGGGSAGAHYNSTYCGGGGAGGYVEGILKPTADTIEVIIGEGANNKTSSSYDVTITADNGGDTFIGDFIAYGGKGGHANSISPYGNGAGGSYYGYFGKDGASGTGDTGNGSEANTADGNGWTLEGTKYGNGGYLYYYNGFKTNVKGTNGVVVLYPMI